MPRLPSLGSLLDWRKRSVPPTFVKASCALNLREGEEAIVTYTPAADKMKIFSAFIREGLENGGAVFYVHPDGESGTVRAKLREHGVNVEKYEKDCALHLKSVTENFMPNGKLELKLAVTDALGWWAKHKKEGFTHERDIEDLGDFSFINGEWQRYVTDYWHNPRWDDPSISEWVESKEPVGLVYVPFIMNVTAINVEHMTKMEVDELLRAIGKGTSVPVRSMDLIEYRDSFSRLIDLDHEGLIGRQILLEFDPISNYEKVIDDFVKESVANVEPMYVFTSGTSSLHAHMGKQPTVKFFLTSVSTSTPQSTSENEMLLPAKNVSLILDSLSTVLETYGDANVCFVFEILSELLTSVGTEKTFTFLRNALDLLSSVKTTSLFLLNTSAHEPRVVSQVRDAFTTLLTYEAPHSMRVVKIL